jgi:hypothetical protein
MPNGSGTGALRSAHSSAIRYRLPRNLFVAAVDRQALAQAAARVRWWPAALAFVLLGFLYALLSDRLTLGPPWALLVLVVGAAIAAQVSHWRGLLHARRMIALGALTATSVAVSVSAAYLIGALLARNEQSGDLLRDAALLWLANTLTFSLWYWEIDGGGPAHRHATHCGSTDFAFPQKVLADRGDSAWMPEYFDYVFLAFNTSTAFSPTDTMVLGRRAKLLMMWQSIVSLVTIAVLAARAINTI